MSAKQADVVKMPSPSASKAPPRHPFDLRYGTETSGLIPHEGMLTGHAHDRWVTAYYGIAPSILDTVIELWMNTPPLHEVDRYTFLDVGAGKGRAMLQASLHPFQHVVGIELNPTLAAVARENVRVFEEQSDTGQLAPLELIEGDALAAPLPATPTVAFLFHPFEAPMLRRFLDRCKQHFAERPGALDILYVNAEHASVFNRDAAFTRMFNGLVPMSSDDHIADLAEIAEQKEYGSTGDEFCTIFRLTGAHESQLEY